MVLLNYQDALSKQLKDLIVLFWWLVDANCTAWSTEALKHVVNDSGEMGKRNFSVKPLDTPF